MRRFALLPLAALVLLVAACQDVGQITQPVGEPRSGVPGPNFSVGASSTAAEISFSTVVTNSSGPFANVFSPGDVAIISYELDANVMDSNGDADAGLYFGATLSLTFEFPGLGLIIDFTQGTVQTFDNTGNPDDQVFIFGEVNQNNSMLGGESIFLSELDFIGTTSMLSSDALPSSILSDVTEVFAFFGTASGFTQVDFSTEVDGPAVDFSGRWEGIATRLDGTIVAGWSWDLTQAGDEVTGLLFAPHGGCVRGGGCAVTGTVASGVLTYQADLSPFSLGDTKGTIGTASIDANGVMMGTWLNVDINGQPSPPGATTDLFSATRNIDPDGDGDGTPDPFDDCPNDFGPPDNNGCPRPEVPEGTPIPNGPSSCEIEVDGKFGTTIEGSTVCVEWADITPVVSLGGESIVYQAFDEVDGEFLYLMYDWIGSGTPLSLGEESGQVRFFVGENVFDVFFIQGGANSTGGTGDDVRVLRNGLPFDNNSDEGPPIVGAVDQNTTSPNFAQPHNLFELKVRLLQTDETPGGLPPGDGGLYSPDPAFWGAALPGSPLTQVSRIILDIGEGGVVTSTRALEVDVDIKPGSDPNCFNNDGHGVIPVAILGSADFDVLDVEPGTVQLAGLSVKVRGKANKLLAHYEDVNGDGFIDLVLQIEDVAGTFASGNGIATLTGQLFDGTPIAGSDDICIVP